MAGASMNDIKSRMKSVESTMQITKAMELVATSKLRRAKERAERSRPYYEALRGAVKGIEASSELAASVWNSEKEAPHLFVVIAGDRGLAGGYNANIFRLSESLSGGEGIFLPIGKKALEYYKHRKREIFSDVFGAVSEVGVGDAFSAASLICEAFKNGRVGKVTLIYTRFVSMMSQLPVYEDILPFVSDITNTKLYPDIINTQIEKNRAVITVQLKSLDDNNYYDVYLTKKKGIWYIKYFWIASENK